MEAYFIFSDEAGDYTHQLGKKLLKSHPYFIRSAVIIKCEEWTILRDSFRSLKEEFKLPVDEELKWSYVFSIIQHRRKGEPIPISSKYYTLGDYSNEELLNFVKEAVNLLIKLSYCRIVYTVTDNEDLKKEYGQKEKENPSEYQFHKWHIQDLMQRTEYELQQCEGLGIMFLDPRKKDDKESKDDSILRSAYVDIYRDDCFVKKYYHVLDSLTFVCSHHSFGIQLADYVAGIFNCFLKGFNEAVGLFKEQIWPLVRKAPNNDPLGWGICEIPSKNYAREKTRKRLIDCGLLPDTEIEILF